MEHINEDIPRYVVSESETSPPVKPPLFEIRMRGKPLLVAHYNGVVETPSDPKENKEVWDWMVRVMQLIAPINIGALAFITPFKTANDQGTVPEVSENQQTPGG